MKKLGIPAGLLFLLPGFAGFAIFYIWPFVISIAYAFLDKPVHGAFAGFSNFLELLGNQAYRKGLANTIRFIAVSVPLNMGVSLGIAIMINKAGKYKELLSLFFLIPLVIPSGSTAFFWKSLFSYDGALNGLLYQLGMAKVNWLDSGRVFFVMVLIFVWKNMGYNMVLYLAGLGNIPKEYYEAGWMEGAGFRQSFRYITVPGLISTSLLVLIMSIINSFKVFKEIYLITGSYPHDSIYTLQHFMNNMFASLNYPKLTTATIFLIMVISLFTQILLRLERRSLA